MAQLGNLLVTGSSRLLGKLFCEDINISDSLVVKTLNANDIIATSVTTSGLTVNGNATTTGTLNVGNSQTNGKISINGKVSIRDYANNGWLGINDTLAWTNGVYFGKTTVRTDGIFQLGDTGNRVLFNQSSAKFSIPVTINNSLAANNITATNVTVNDTLKAFKYELNTIQDLGGEFCVAPIIYIQSGAKVQVNKDSATTIVVSIQDTNAIKSDTIQGVRWAEKSKIKFQGKINGLSIRCNGVMKSKLNTVQNTMSLILTVDSNIANSFSTSVANATSYSDISVMLYQRVTKNSQAKDVYYPVGIRMSSTGSANSAPYVDIWGSKSNSDPDTVYTVPSVRLGYLGDISMTLNGSSISCNGYGLYADNVYLKGTVISNSGTIGGFKIGTNDLSNGTWGTDKSVLMSTGTTENKAIGGSDVINGWCFTAGSKFGVTKNGNMYASSGKVGQFTISDNALGYGEITDDNINDYLIKTDPWNNSILLSTKNILLGNSNTYLSLSSGTGKLLFSDGVSNGVYGTQLDCDHLYMIHKGYANMLPIDRAESYYVQLLDNSSIYYESLHTPSYDTYGWYDSSSICLKYRTPASFGTSDYDDFFYIGTVTSNSPYINNYKNNITFQNTVLTFGRSKSTNFWDVYSRGNMSTILGHYNLAVGRYSFSGGLECESEGVASFVYGTGLYSDNHNQTVIGKYNQHHLNKSITFTEDNIQNIKSSAFIIGNGTSNTDRSNAFTVDWDGNTWAAGSITATGSVKGTDFNGFTINKSVPSDAKFTDTVTVIENSCDSDSTTSALSAAQGKSLKTYIDNVNTNIWNSLNNSYRANYNAQYNTPVPLLINGNSLGHANAQLILEYNNSYIRFRNDGSSFYIMNGDGNSWTNYITFYTGGGVVVPNTLKVPTCLYVPYATKASTTSAANAYISADGNGVLAKTSKTSSRRFKDDITTDLDDDLNPQSLYDVDVVQFKYKKDYFTNEEDIRYRKNLIGFIAEDVYDKYKIAADWHVDDETGEVLVDAWNEQYMIPAMLKLIQEQHMEIEQLKDRLEGIENVN